MRFRLSSTPKTPENADENGGFQKRFESGTFLKPLQFKKKLWPSTEAFENGDEKSVIFCSVCQRFCAFFSVGNRLNRIKEYDFPNENESV